MSDVIPFVKKTQEKTEEVVTEDNLSEIEIRRFRCPSPEFCDGNFTANFRSIAIWIESDFLRTFSSSSKYTFVT